MNIRERTEEMEKRTLSLYATCSVDTRGREREEAPCSVRTAFQRDRDRIIHSKAFRRLKHKTQVFIAPQGDHYRTRLTHTLEVAQVARTIAKALRLNEDLTEAIALGHDLGHTPFGHSGEEVLNEIHPGGFAHNLQSRRVVEVLEQGKGLNLTWEVRDGIGNHTGDCQPSTLEGWVVKISDRIAYINHDIDDALRGGIISADDLPGDCLEVLGFSHSQRINTMVSDVIEQSWNQPRVTMSPRVLDATNRLREFLFSRVYIGSAAKREEQKARHLVRHLYSFYLEHPEELPEGAWTPGQDLARAVCDYVAGMTDRYAITQYERHFVPSPWRFEDLL